MNDTTAQHSVTNIAPAFPRKLIVWTATLDGMFAPAINTTTCYVLLRIHGVTIIYSAMPDKYAGPPYSWIKTYAARVICTIIIIIIIYYARRQHNITSPLQKNSRKAQEAKN